MADIYMYADETGDLGIDGEKGASAYFGIGTATFTGDHGAALWDGLQLRFELEKKGLDLAKGFHAKNDSWATRNDVYKLIGDQAPRFDTTLLAKENIYPSVRAGGQLRVYKMAWYLHFKEISKRVSQPGDTLHVVAATLQTKARKKAVRGALEDVCAQGPIGRDINLCVWDNATSWGLQVADYALWAVQRRLETGTCDWWHYVEPTLASEFYPWNHPSK